MSLAVHDVRPLNRSGLLACLRDRGPLARGDLARELALSHSAVTNVAAELLLDGVLKEESPDLTGERRVGRPSTTLAIDEASRTVIGVQVGVGTVHVALCDLFGQVLAKESRCFSVEDGPAAAVSAIVPASRTLLNEVSTPILGIGVGAPGPVDEEARVNLMSVNLGWSDVPFADLLEEALDLPTVVDHNVRAMAIGESRFGRFRGADSLAFVYARTGIGAGMVVGGRPYRGGVHGVIELGHLPVTPSGPLCACGNRGCLEAFVAEPALERIVGAAGKRRGTPIARALHSGATPIAAVLRAVETGDPTAEALLSGLIEHFATALVGMVNLLNPAVVIAGGYLSEVGDTLIDQLRALLVSRAFPVLRSRIQLEPASFGADSGVVGAAALALDTFFYDPQIRGRGGPKAREAAARASRAVRGPKPRPTVRKVHA